MTCRERKSKNRVLGKFVCTCFSVAGLLSHNTFSGSTVSISGLSERVVGNTLLWITFFFPGKGKG